MAKKNIIRTHRGIASTASKTLRSAKSLALRRLAASALSNRRRLAK